MKPNQQKKLANAYSGKSKLCGMLYISEDIDIMLRSSNGKVIIFNTSLLNPKSTRDTIGVQTMTLKGNYVWSKFKLLMKKCLRR